MRSSFGNAANAAAAAARRRSTASSAVNRGRSGSARRRGRRRTRCARSRACRAESCARRRPTRPTVARDSCRRTTRATPSAVGCIGRALVRGRGAFAERRRDAGHVQPSRAAQRGRPVDRVGRRERERRVRAVVEHLAGAHAGAGVEKYRPMRPGADTIALVSTPWRRSSRDGRVRRARSSGTMLTMPRRRRSAQATPRRCASAPPKCASSRGRLEQQLAVAGCASRSRSSPKQTMRRHRAHRAHRASQPPSTGRITPCT